VIYREPAIFHHVNTILLNNCLLYTKIKVKFIFMNFVVFVDGQIDIKIKKVQSDKDIKFKYV